MGANIVAADGPGSARASAPGRDRAAGPPGIGFAMLRAPCAEPAARPLRRASEPRRGDADPVPLTDGGQRAAAPPPTDGPVRAVHPDAHRFVLSTLRPVFEVLDRRRPAKHLTSIASSTVVDVLRTLAENGPRARVSTWNDVHVAAPRRITPRARARTAGAEIGAEIFLTYTRAGRVLAAAGRVESTGGRWRWVAFTTAA